MKNEPHCINKNDLLERTKQDIAQFGLQVISVTSTDYLPSFSYSIGLTQTYQHPEIICFGLSSSLGHEIVNDIASMIKNGIIFEDGKIYTDIFQDSKATFLTVDQSNLEYYFGAGLNYYQGEKFIALELIWTDRNDLFPWEENFEEEFLYQQPLLDRNTAFKFNEPQHLRIFTTRQWLEEHKPILRVVHDHDGDWQFLTGDQIPEDIRVVALSEIVRSDHTLNEVFDLEYGEDAERASVGEAWERNSLEEYEEE